MGAAFNFYIIPRSLRTLLLFIFLVAATFLAGSLLSYPVYLILSTLSEIRYYKVLHFSILLTGLIIGLIYLKAGSQTGILGLDTPPRKTLRYFTCGFSGGLAVLVIVEASLFGMGMRQIDPDLYQGLPVLGRAVTAALLSGITVGITEEMLFRGVIFTGLARYAGHLYALTVSSVFYAAVHFIDIRSLSSATDIGWLTGVTALGSIFGRFGNPEIYDSFTSLCVLGVLFGLTRWHTGNIILSVGLHAGIVTGNKIFSFATDYREGGAYNVLVNVYDKTTGHLATFWLALACIIYYYFYMRAQSGSQQ